MIFIHPNFPKLAAIMLRALEKGRKNPVQFLMPEETGEVSEWLSNVTAWAKQEQTHPFIVTWDDGIRDNAITSDLMRQTGCNFVVFDRKWGKTPWEEVSWRLMKFWPKIPIEMVKARLSGHLCKLEVSTNGRVNRFNV